MSQYFPEHEPGVMTEEPIAVVMTDPESRSDDYRSAPSSTSAREQVGTVTEEAKYQAKDLLGQGREELRQQAAQQQDRVANGLHTLSQELRSMASGSTEQGVAADVAREAAHHADTLANWLDVREPGQLLDQVRSFARQRPGAFLGIAAAAGVVVGRLGRGLKEGEPQAPRHAATPESGRSVADPMTDTAGDWSGGRS